MRCMAKAVVVGVGTVILLAGCESTEERLDLKKPTAQLVGVELRDASAYGATLVFNVDILNHYSSDLPLRNLNYVLSSRGQRVLAGSAELSVTVPAFGRRTVSLPARVDYIKLLRALGGVRPGSTIPYDAELGLAVSTPRFGPITLQLSRGGELALPEVPGANLDELLGPAGSR